MQRAIDEYFRLLMAGSFEALERAAEEGRKGARLSDGQPVLGALYAATAGEADSGQSEPAWKARRFRLLEWRKQFPDSIAAKVSIASFPLYYGWFARGTGFAPTVSPEAMATMMQRVEEARIALEGLDSASKGDAGWAPAMISIGNLQSWPRERIEALYEAAVSKHPDYLPLYFTWVQYYRPRWHGSPELERWAVEKIVERTRERMGETMYARLNWGLASNDMFASGQVSWPRMRAGFERVLRDYPDAWNLNNYARFACMASDWETMVRLGDRIGNKPLDEVWMAADAYQRCNSVARALLPKK